MKYSDDSFSIDLDDDLVRTAQELTGVRDIATILHHALKALVERESAHRLAALGGTMPELKDISRR